MLRKALLQKVLPPISSPNNLSAALIRAWRSGHLEVDNQKYGHDRRWGAHEQGLVRIGILARRKSCMYPSSMDRPSTVSAHWRGKPHRRRAAADGRMRPSPAKIEITSPKLQAGWDFVLSPRDPQGQIRAKRACRRGSLTSADGIMLPPRSPGVPQGSPRQPDHADDPDHAGSGVHAHKG